MVGHELIESVNKIYKALSKRKKCAFKIILAAILHNFFSALSSLQISSTGGTVVVTDLVGLNKFYTKFMCTYLLCL